MKNLADTLAESSHLGDAIVTPSRRVSWCDMMRLASGIRAGDCQQGIVEGGVIDVAVKLIAFDGYATSRVVMPQGCVTRPELGEHSEAKRSESYQKLSMAHSR